jgi:Fe-S cluster assembly iron-binding protein IscA
MFDANAVSKSLTLVNTVTNEDTVSYNFSCNEQITCSGAQYSWGYTADGDVVAVTGINVHETKYDDDEFCTVNVVLENDEQMVYTDKAFANAISALLNMNVDYTEQGMQDYGLVSMET